MTFGLRCENVGLGQQERNSLLPGTRMCRYGARQHSNVRMGERANAGNCEMIISWL